MFYFVVSKQNLAFFSKMPRFKPCKIKESLKQYNTSKNFSIFAGNLRNTNL